MHHVTHMVLQNGRQSNALASSDKRDSSTFVGNPYNETEYLSYLQTPSPLAEWRREQCPVVLQPQGRADALERVQLREVLPPEPAVDAAVGDRHAGPDQALRDVLR